MSDFVNIWKNLDWSVPVQIVVNILPSLLCITLHELSHGYVAYRLGDTTAKDAGRLTLNPIKHIDVMGLLMMVVFRFGWAKPVPVNMYRFKNPKKGMAVTALAGKKIRVLRRDIEIGADYTSEEPTVSARIVLSLQLFRLVHLAVALGVEFLKWKINSRPEDKPAAATNERKDDNGRE